MHVTIGRVSTRKGARQHLDTLGRAHCGAGSGVTLAATRWTVDGTVATDTICRRCLPALRARLAEAALTGDPNASDAAHMLTPMTDDERDAKLTEMADFLARRWAPPPAEPIEVTMARRAALYASLQSA